MTNTNWHIKQQQQKAVNMFELSSNNHKFITKENFYRFNCKNDYQAFKNLFQIFLIYEFPFRKTGE